MTETETIQTIKPWYKRALACFCSFLICCLVCFCGFAIPKVHAESIADQFEDYIDSMTFEGATTIAETFTETVADSYGLGVVFDGVMIGLNIIEANNIGSSIPLSALSSCNGYYYYKNKKWFASSTVTSGQYFPSDGGITIAKSANYEIRWQFVFQDAPSSLAMYISNNNYGPQPGLSASWGSSGHSWSVDVSSQSTIWEDFTVTQNNWPNSYTPFYLVQYGNNIPSLNDGMNGNVMLLRTSYAYGNNCIAGGDRTIFTWSDVLPSMGVDPNATVDPSNIYDFIENDFNPVIIENYPQLVQYLFIPQETPTETTSPCGCGCHVDVYVDVEPTIIVEPTINVYVNPWELPSDEQDYTFPSNPVHETIPFPTQDSSNTEPVTMPTMDLEEFQQTYKNAFDFWFYCAEQLIEKMNLQLLLAFVFVVTVVGFIMWKLGG